MKKMSVTEMTQSNGGTRYVCRKCGSTFYFQWTAGYHIAFTGHNSFKKYAW